MKTYVNDEDEDDDNNDAATMKTTREDMHLMSGEESNEY